MRYTRDAIAMNGDDRVGETLALGGDEVFVGASGDEPPDDGDDPGDGIPDSYVQVGSVLIFPDVPSCP